MIRLLPCIFTVVCATTAAAADLPYRGAPAFAPELPPTVFSWTGFYAGMNVGADLSGGSAAQITGNNALNQSNTVTGLRPSYSAIRDDGFAGGAQIGYNRELASPFTGVGNGAVVLGAEADIDYVGIGGSAAYFSDRASLFQSKTDYLGTVRGRVGYAFDSILVYATGGFAYGGASNTTSFLNPVGTQIYNGHSSGTRTGYAVGGGVEVAVPNMPMVHLTHGGAMTVRLEYLRYELGPTSYAIPNNLGLDPGYTQRVRNTGNILRAGVNYKFDAISTPPAPVVARY